MTALVQAHDASKTPTRTKVQQFPRNHRPRLRRTQLQPTQARLHPTVVVPGRLGRRCFHGRTLLRLKARWFSSTCSADTVHRSAYCTLLRDSGHPGMFPRNFLLMLLLSNSARCLWSLSFMKSKDPVVYLREGMLCFTDYYNVAEHK